MSWRTRIAQWLNPPERMGVMVEQGKDGRWRWYAFSYAQVMIAQSPPDGFATAKQCKSAIGGLFLNGWRVSIRLVEYTPGPRDIPERQETS